MRSNSRHGLLGTHRAPAAHSPTTQWHPLLAARSLTTYPLCHLSLSNVSSSVSNSISNGTSWPQNPGEILSGYFYRDCRKHRKQLPSKTWLFNEGAKKTHVGLFTVVGKAVRTSRCRCPGWNTLIARYSFSGLHTEV